MPVPSPPARTPVPDMVLVGGLQKQKISAFDKEYRRSTMDTRRAGFTVEEFVSDLGINLRVVVDRWIPEDIIEMSCRHCNAATRVSKKEPHYEPKRARGGKELRSSGLDILAGNDLAFVLGSNISSACGPMDRALASGVRGCGFESRQARHRIAELSGDRGSWQRVMTAHIDSRYVRHTVCSCCVAVNADVFRRSPSSVDAGAIGFLARLEAG